MIDDMLVINDHIQQLDQLIELSIFKIRQMQLTGNVIEYKKCLIVSTLQSCIEEKHQILQRITHDAIKVDTFSGILKTAIQKSGLYRLIRIGVRKDDNMIQVKTKISKREKRMMYQNLF